MKNRKLVILLLGAFALPLASGLSTRAEEPPKPDCHVDVNTDNGNGGMQAQQCDKSVKFGFSGPIKDVDWDHPVGKGDAAIPKAGRDIEHAAHDLGHAAEQGSQWLGDRLGIHW